MYLSYWRKWAQYFRHCSVVTGVNFKSLITTTVRQSTEIMGWKKKVEGNVWKFYFKA